MNLSIRTLHLDAPGDRGGVVIGKTGSGKAIYESHHGSHAGWTQRDHEHAAAHHGKITEGLRTGAHHQAAKDLHPELKRIHDQSLAAQRFHERAGARKA